MAEENATTAPETTEAPATGGEPAPAASSARDAALAALGDDFGAEHADGEEGAEPAAEAETEAAAAPPPEPPKELLSPQLRAIAAQEKRARELAEGARAESAKVSAERAALEQERARWQEEMAKPMASVEEVRRRFSTDPVALADELKLTPQQRQQLATDLYWSSQPEDKRPPTYRSQGAQRSEVETLRERTERLERMLTERDQAEKQAREEQAAAGRRREMAAAVLNEGKAAEAAPYVAAYAEAFPEAAAQHLEALAKRMIASADDPGSVTSAMVVAEYEKMLTAELAWTSKAVQKAAKVAPKAPPSGTKVATPLTNQGTASPTRAPGKMTAEERRAAALAALDD